MVERIEHYIKLTEERMKNKVKKDKDGKPISEPLMMYKVHEMAMMWMMNDLASAVNQISNFISQMPEYHAEEENTTEEASIDKEEEK